MNNRVSKIRALPWRPRARAGGVPTERGRGCPLTPPSSTHIGKLATSGQIANARVAVLLERPLHPELVDLPSQAMAMTWGDIICSSMEGFRAGRCGPQPGSTAKARTHA